jgi:hypothetical protein
MRYARTSWQRLHGDWLVLEILRGAVLAAAVGIGAAAVRNVTATLEFAAYGRASPRTAVQVPPPPSCGGAVSRGSCRALPVQAAAERGPV